MVGIVSSSNEVEGSQTVFIPLHHTDFEFLQEMALLFYTAVHIFVLTS